MGGACTQEARERTEETRGGAVQRIRSDADARLRWRLLGRHLALAALTKEISVRRTSPRSVTMSRWSEEVRHRVLEPMQPI